MKKIISQAEIAILDSAIKFMSRAETPRIYSQTVARATLYLRRDNQIFASQTGNGIAALRHSLWVRWTITALTGLIVGIIFGWVKTHL